MIPGLGRPLEKEMATHSSIENPMDGGAWWATVHRIAKSRTRLSNFTFTYLALQGSVRILAGKQVDITLKLRDLESVY